MTDIVERLRNLEPGLSEEAADEIERLRAELERFGAAYDKADKEAADEIRRLRAELQTVAGKLLGLRAATIEECARIAETMNWPNTAAAIRALAKEEK